MNHQGAGHNGPSHGGHRDPHQHRQPHHTEPPQHWDHQGQHHGHHHQQHHQHQPQRDPRQQHHHPNDPNAPPPKWHSFKMLVDPTIHRGAAKMVRFDGSIVPGNPHHVPPIPLDPRNRLPNALWKRMEAMDLPVPRFKIDDNYVGEPPKVEVTVENMNDNIDQQFLTRMVEKYGVIEDLKIYYHPINGKHLGLAHLYFEEVKSAKECVKYLHGKSVMGQQLNCYIDPLAKSCLKMYTDLTEEKKPEPVEEPPTPPSNVNHPHTSHLMEDEYNKDSGSESRIDWSHHRYPPPGHHPPMQQQPSRRESRVDPRRPSYDHDRRHSRDFSREGSHSQDEGGLDLPTPVPSAGPPIQPTAPPVDNDDKYKPTVFDPTYWQQEAQKYAAAITATMQPQQQTSAVASAVASGQLPETEDLSPSGDEAVSDTKEEVKSEIKDENDENDSDHQVDLDTRLKMLMKNKAGGAMPSFLLNQFNGSGEDEEEDSENNEVKNALENPDNNDIVSKHAPESAIPPLPAIFTPEKPLSRAPSPFLTETHYQNCHNSWQNQRQEEFDKKYGIKKDEKLGKKAKSDDGMSLSSLSSGENNILQQGLPLPNYYGSQFPAPPPGYDPMSHQPNWYTEQYIQHQHGQHPQGSYEGGPPGPHGHHAWPGYWHGHPHGMGGPGGDMQHGYDPNQAYPYNTQNHWQDPYAAIKESLRSGKKSEKNLFRPIIK